MILEFIFNAVYTFGSNDLEHRFIIRNYVLTNNIQFNKHLVNPNGQYKITLNIKRNKKRWDIDNVPKVFIDSFSKEQIENDLRELDSYLKNPNNVSKTKQKAYEKILDNKLYDDTLDYTSLGIYKEDTVLHVRELHCIGEYIQDLKIDEIIVKIEIYKGGN